MTGKKFTLKYGKGTLSFEIPADRLLYELVGSNRPAVPNLAQDYLYALDHLIDSASLSERVKPGERVAIVVSDITRAWQRNDYQTFLKMFLTPSRTPSTIESWV